MNMHRILAICLLAVSYGAPCAAQDTLPADVLRCDGEAPPADEISITHGPFRNGAWRLRVTAGADADTPARMHVETFEYLPAEHVVLRTGEFSRSIGSSVMRPLRRASLTMINEIELKEDEPELYAQRRPLTIQVGTSDGGTRCASGYANWPRLPGSYYFEAVELLRDSVIDESMAGDVRQAVRLLFDQVKPARKRR